MSVTILEYTNITVLNELRTASNSLSWIRDNDSVIDDEDVLDMVKKINNLIIKVESCIEVGE